MAIFASQRLKSDTAVVPMTTVQRALWQMGMPILVADAVAEYKKHAKREMLWCAIRRPLLGMVALVAFICLGQQWSGAALVGAAAALLSTLFGWLVNTSELQWRTGSYSTYRDAFAVPSHVSAAVDALVCCGVPQTGISVEYLKEDPILFVEDSEQSSGIKRYDLIIW